MALPTRSAQQARTIHRYVGFFLAGVMAMYAMTGIVLVFRNTDFLKQEQAYAKTVAANLDAEALGKAIGIKRLKFAGGDGEVLTFEPAGSYNRVSGEVRYTKKELPVLLGKLTKLHKATTDSPLYWLNIGFGLSLLGFVITAFWMYLPGGPILRKGLLFALGGVLLVVVMLLV